nr:MAG TPA: hypothetical protein [Caudoviricetes sp.]
MELIYIGCYARAKIILKFCIEHREIADTKGWKALFLMLKNCYNFGVEKRYRP